MKRNPMSAQLLVAIALSSLALENANAAQNVNKGWTQDTGVVLTKLSPPVYPPLARQARIQGDVRIQVGIRRDGSIASVEVISGHPILTQSALESAKKSTFECKACSDEISSYFVTYTFGFEGECRFGPNCEALEPRAFDVKQTPGRVILSVEPLCTCDPAGKIVRVRAAKCFYLWRCGTRELNDE